MAYDIKEGQTLEDFITEHHQGAMKNPKIFADVINDVKSAGFDIENLSAQKIKHAVMEIMSFNYEDMTENVKYHNDCILIITNFDNTENTYNILCKYSEYNDTIVLTENEKIVMLKLPFNSSKIYDPYLYFIQKLGVDFDYVTFANRFNYPFMQKKDNPAKLYIDGNIDDKVKDTMQYSNGETLARIVQECPDYFDGTFVFNDGEYTIAQLKEKYNIS